MPLDGLLVDLDGTLIDSNPVHVAAWLEALRSHGYRVAPDRIAVEVGKGGDLLVPALLGASVERVDGEALRTAQADVFAQLAGRVGLPVQPGAEELLAALRDRKIRSALVTSSDDRQLDVAERESRVPWRDLFDEVVVGNEAAASKPHPDLVLAALEKLHLSAPQCAMLGDTPWDVLAAHRVGVEAIAVTAGGRTAAELHDAGARVVCTDPAAVVADLDGIARCVAPGALRLDRDMLATLMRHALAAAEEGLLAGELPIGALLVSGDGTPLGRAHDRFNGSTDRLHHAAIGACAAVGHGCAPPGTVLVSTVEPCLMCMGAAAAIGVYLVVYALPRGGAARATTGRVRVVGGVLAQRSRALLMDWLERPARNAAQEPHVLRLLGRDER